MAERYGCDDVPDGIVRGAKAAFSRRADAELAFEVFDSLLDGGASPTDHRICFEHPCVSIEVRVLVGVGSSRLTGTVDPPIRRQIELQSGSTDLRLVDHSVEGVFSFDQVEPGAIRLHLSGTACAPATHTDWFRV
jgi:hypothetical protein